jgi:hypothetical protein
MWDIYMNNPNTYKMKTKELKKIEQIDKKLKSFEYRTISSQKSPPKPTYCSIQRPHSDQPSSNLFLLKDLEKLDNFNTIHVIGGSTASQTNWWQNKIQWEKVPTDTQSMKSLKNFEHSDETKLNVAINNQPASSLNSISRFTVEKLHSDIV